MRNELTKLKPRAVESGIMNLDDIYRTSTGSGSHWTCWTNRNKKCY